MEFSPFTQPSAQSSFQDNLKIRASEGFVQLAKRTVEFAIKAHASYGDGSEIFATGLVISYHGINAEHPPGTSTIDGDSINRAHELMMQFKNDGAIKHSDEAIAILDSILVSAPTEYSSRHYILFNLALVLCRRVEIQVSQRPTDTLLELHNALERSLILLREAVHISPAADSSLSALNYKVKYLNQLGRTASLWSTLLSTDWKYANSQVLELVEAERRSTDRLESTGIVTAIIMASTLSTAYSVTKDMRYRKEGRDLYHSLIASLEGALPIEALISDLIRESLFTRLPILVTFMTEAFIPFIVQFVGLTMQRLVEVPLSAVIGRRAAAAAFSYQKPMQGVEWLEQCLMIVWSQMRGAVAPGDAIHLELTPEAGPEGHMRQAMLAFLGLCVDTDLVRGDQSSLAQPEFIAYHLVKHWLQLMENMRGSPVPSALFQPRPFEYLLNAARTSPVVMLNLWGTQCNALILHAQSGRPTKNAAYEVLTLDGVTEDLAGKLQAGLRRGLDELGRHARGDEGTEDSETKMRGDYPDASTKIVRTLQILWDLIVKPVFDKLELQPLDDPTSDPPRLVWCLTGTTSFFPLHAAGRYGEKTPGTKAFEYVASSYTPTLSILADANDTLLHTLESPFSGVLAVSVPNAPNMPQIPNTVPEVQTFQTIVRESDSSVRFQWLDGDKATRAAVLEGMKSSAWVHLACHARQYPLNTSESAFVLAGGETLSLADIGENPSVDGELAFLSACQTAAGDSDLSEEGVHLAAGMLVAGYRSVIASAWSVGDRDARDIAEAVYRRLLLGGRVDRTGAALALHHAVRKLRERLQETGRLEDFIRWAPFMHFGV